MATKRTRRDRQHDELGPILRAWEAGDLPPRRKPTSDEREEAISCVYGLHPRYRTRSGHDHPHAAAWLQWIKP